MEVRHPNPDQAASPGRAIGEFGPASSSRPGVGAAANASNLCQPLAGALEMILIRAPGYLRFGGFDLTVF